MNILVSAAALRTSGARTIYRQFVEHLKTRVDCNHYYILVDKVMEMPEIDGVKFIVVDTNNKIKRLIFDAFIFKSLVRRYNIFPDVVISLQNIGLRNFRHLPQIIYYHQPLPFFDYSWNLFKKDELLMFLYKYLYPFFVKRTIGNKTEIVVQLPSIKKGLVKKFKVQPNRVHVLFPDTESVDISIFPKYPFDMNMINFVFPATGAPYKGHRFLISVMDKVRILNKSLADRIRIHLTLDEDSSQEMIKVMCENGVKENFVFHGVVPHNTLFSMYRGSCGLLFPSVIETLGLPLIEVARFGKPIIACDLEYAHEVLAGYSGVNFIESRSLDQWANAICDVAKLQQTFTPLLGNERSSWEDFFDLINKL